MPEKGCLLQAVFRWETKIHTTRFTFEIQSKELGKFDAQTLKGKTLFFFCNIAWPQYKLRDGEIWPGNQSLNYNAILQLNFSVKGRASGLKYHMCRSLWP